MRIKVLLLCLPCVVVLLVWLNREPGPVSGLKWISTPPPALPPAPTASLWKTRITAPFKRATQWLARQPPVLISTVMYESYPSTLLSCVPADAARYTNDSGARAFVISDGQALQNRLKGQRSQLIIGPVPPIGLRNGERRHVAHARTVWIGGYDPSRFGFPGEVRINATTNPYPASGGWWVDVCPRLHGGNIELESFFRCTEGVTQDGKAAWGYSENLAALRTNASFGAHTQITNGGGLFLISSQTNRNQKAVAVLILPTLRPRGGR